MTHFVGSSVPFYLKFNRRIFFCGTIVKGKVCFSSVKDTGPPIDKIKVWIEGTIKVTVKSSHLAEDEETTEDLKKKSPKTPKSQSGTKADTIYTGQQHFGPVETIPFEKSNTDRIIKAGDIVEFGLKTDGTWPQTCLSDQGTISYMVCATVYPYETTVKSTVELLAVNESEATQAAVDWKQTPTINVSNDSTRFTINYCCCKHGESSINLNVEKILCQQDSNCDVEVSIKNYNRCKVDMILQRASIMQKTTYITENPLKKEHIELKEICHETLKERLGQWVADEVDTKYTVKSKRDIKLLAKFNIPRHIVPSTLARDHIIRFDYFIQVLAEVRGRRQRCSTDLRTSIPIILQSLQQ